MSNSKRLIHTALLPPLFDGQRLSSVPNSQNLKQQSRWGSFNSNYIYFNRSFDKSRLKGLVKWSLAYFGEKKTIDLVETLKSVGYTSATRAGLSLSIDDLLVPPSKIPLMIQTETKLEHTQRRVSKGYLTSIEYLSQVIANWNVTNDVIKNQVIAHFRSQDILNPVYMMAFSGARGNISQVRQLTGMRGLMSDPSGRIIDYAIQSNFREGLTLTEYVISCYGARKGVVDTALRTATSGYLTRRLVDVAQHVVIRSYDCRTTKGIFLASLEDEEKVFMTGSSRLIGRVLAEDVYDSNSKRLLAKRNQDVPPPLAKLLFKHHSKILVRSALTCDDRSFVCQLCYGWNLAKGRLVPLGETVGIIAAQSIGEPGTQLTMRTFHTGGVFSGEISKTFQSPIYGRVSFLNSIAGKCVRTDQGEIAFLTKQSGIIYLTPLENGEKKRVSKVFLKPYTLLFVKQGEIVYPDQILAEPSSLERLGQRNQTFQTIFAPLSGEVKFRTAQLTKGAHNPNFTTSVPLSQSSSEFWILSSQTQTFRNPFKTFVQPGDQVELKSPVFTSLILSKKDTLNLNSFVFQRYVSFYRAQTLFSVVPLIQSSRPTEYEPFYVSNFDTQPSFWLSSPLMKRGTFMERLFPFVSFFPKRRYLFEWNQVEKKVKTQATFFDDEKKLINRNQKKQTKKLKKRSAIEKIFQLKRSFNIDKQPCKKPMSIVYPFTFNQKKQLVKLRSVKSYTPTKKRFELMSHFTRKKDSSYLSVFSPLLARFEQQLFLSHSIPLSYSDTIFFTDYKDRLCLKQPEKIRDAYLGKVISTLPPIYSPWEKLWFIAHLKQPTPDFQKPFYAVFPQKIAWNLNKQLRLESSTRNNLLKANPLPFCFYYRLLTHFRFQKFYENLFSQLISCEPTFSPIPLRQCRYGFDPINEEFTWILDKWKKVLFFPKSLLFLDRIQQSICLKAFVLLVKQKQKNQYQPFFQWAEKPGDLNSPHYQQKFDFLNLETTALSNSELPEKNPFQLQKPRFQLDFLKDCAKNNFSLIWEEIIWHQRKPKRQDNKKMSLLRHLNKIFAFHEFNQVPFCFDIFSTKLTQKFFQSTKMNPDKNKSVLHTCSNQTLLVPNIFQISQIQNLSTFKQIKKKKQITNDISQKAILLYLLKHKVDFRWGDLKQFVGFLHLLIVYVHKLFFWKQAFEKLRQILVFYQFTDFYNQKKNVEMLELTQTNESHKPMSAIYFFVQKVSYKKGTLRSSQTHFLKQGFSRSNKRAWLSINKRFQTAIARLHIVYCLTKRNPDPFLTSFQLFSCRTAVSKIKTATMQKKMDSFFLIKWASDISFFNTNYYDYWNQISKKQIQTQFQKQSFFQEWTQNETLLVKTKSTAFNKQKKSYPMIHSFLHLWLDRNGKKISRNFPIQITTVLFGAHQSIRLDQPSYLKRVSIFLQKSCEKQFLAKFYHSCSKEILNLTLFLLEQKSKQRDYSIFSLGILLFIVNRNYLPEFAQTLKRNQSSEKRNQNIICFLKQMKKKNLQKNLQKLTKVNKKVKKSTPQEKQRNNLKLMKPSFVKQYFSTCFRLTNYHRNLLHNERQYFNPFSWVSFIRCSKTALKQETRLNVFDQLLKMGSTRETLFAFSSTKFQPVYDPWWRHSMHEIYILSILKNLKKKTYLNKCSFASFGRFLKKPNRFFSYLEKQFFNPSIIGTINIQNKERDLFKKIFIEFISFYTQKIKLKAKKGQSILNSFSLNKNNLNYYVRLIFLKTAKLPLIIATKNPIPAQIQKRVIIISLKKIYISKNTRYRPIFIFEALKYQKENRATQMNIQILPKSAYILSIRQKETLYRTGSSIMKTFVQEKLSGIMQIAPCGSKIPQKQYSIPSLNQISENFDSSRLNKFQLTLLHHYFNPTLNWSQLYQQMNPLTYLYVSPLFTASKKICKYSCGFIQKRDFRSYNNPMAIVHSKRNQTLSNKNEMLMKEQKKIIEMSPVTGIVLQCFDLYNKAEKAMPYEYGMRKFRYQSETLCSISYLTDTDMLTYRISPPQQKLGSFISYGERLISTQKIINNLPVVDKDKNPSGFLLKEPGQIIYITKTKIVMRRAQCFLLASGSECNLNQGDLVSFGAPLVTVAYSQIQADDIIQGIPKIDQFFEARTRINSVSLKQMLAKKYAFLRKEKKQSKREIILKSFNFIQKRIVDGIQTVYQSQGVTISDKHIEVIVRQMTSKVRIRTALGSGFLQGDIVPFYVVELGGYFDTDDVAFECEPVLLGITQTSLQAEGFLSAASFQETIRVLSQAAVVRKTDYIKNLKENIIVGHLLPSGTGLRK